MIPGSGGSPGEGIGYPFQYSCLEIPWKRSLAGYSPWGCKELDMTKRLTLENFNWSEVNGETGGIILRTFVCEGWQGQEIRSQNLMEILLEWIVSFQSFQGNLNNEVS